MTDQVKCGVVPSANMGRQLCVDKVQQYNEIDTHELLPHCIVSTLDMEIGIRGWMVTGKYAYNNYHKILFSSINISGINLNCWKSW